MITALVLSGGNGSRLSNDFPKQYIEVGGMLIISYCIKTLSASNEIDAIWIVADEKGQNIILKSIIKSDINKKIKGFSTPGVNRQLSIYNGIKDIKRELFDTELVLIHDAARPLLTTTEIKNCIRASIGHEGAIPVLPMKDTVYMSVDGETISGLLQRKQVFLGQAPEVFVIDKYIEANEQLIEWVEDYSEISSNSSILNINGSTEPAILAGMDIAMILGNENNFKITTRADLERFRSIVGGDITYEGMGFKEYW